MKTNDKHDVVARITRASLVLAAVFGLVLSAANVSRAQAASGSVAAGRSAAQAPELASDAARPAANPSEAPSSGGVKVHGHWTIDIKNPDGKITTHREFENSLDPNAGADVLTGQDYSQILGVL